jgi:hypothetical protein
VTLWQRAPREVYRVYGEDEYLSADDAHATQGESQPRAGEEGSPSLLGGDLRYSRSGRLLGLGLLVVVTVGAVGLVVASASHRHVAPSSGVLRGAPANIASPSSATESVKHGQAVRKQTFAVPSSGERTVRSPLLLSPARRSYTKTGKSVLIQVPTRIPLPQAEISAPVGPATHIDGEFDFER